MTSSSGGRLGLAVSLLLLSALGAGCAQRITSVRPTALESQRVVYRNDRPSTTSARTNRVVVTLPHERATPARFAVLVEVFNGSDAEFDFGPADVALELDGVAIAVPVRDDVAREDRSRAATSKLFLGLGSAMSAYGNREGTSETSGSISGTDSRGHAVHGTYHETTVDYAKQAEARRRDDSEYLARSDEIDRRLAEKLATYEDTYLGRNTLAPGDAAGGEIYVALPWCGKPSCTLRMRVRTGAEVHEFTFEVSQR